MPHSKFSPLLLIILLLWLSTACVARPQATRSSARLGCMKQRPLDCLQLSHRYRPGSETRADPDRAQDLAERACRLGSSEGCIYAAYDQARLTQDNGRLYTALSRLNHHCALGQWLACAFVGELHEDGYHLARGP